MDYQRNEIMNLKVADKILFATFFPGSERKTVVYCVQRKGNAGQQIPTGVHRIQQR